VNGAQRPITVLIAATGGEGGGLLMRWIVNAAMAQGLPVQATSVPGVAQRTGATTYYIEIFPVPLEELCGREPVLSLYPSVGDIDLVVATELVEVGRTIERGFVSPERTTLIGSTHRFYAIAEKAIGDDGRYDAARILDAAPAVAKRAILFDGERVAREDGHMLNAVLLGAIAVSGTLPIPRSGFEHAIRVVGEAVENNLGGFARGLAAGGADLVTATPADDREIAGDEPHSRVPGEELLPPRATDDNEKALFNRVCRDHPAPAQAIVLEGVSQLVDYQDAAYAELYLDRLDTILADECDGSDDAGVISTTGRYLALRMSHEDLIRVAQLKTRRGRFERVRDEVGAEPDDVVTITEFLAPGVRELCSVLPPFIARPILSWASKRASTNGPHVGMRVKTTSVSGFFSLWLMAKLRPLRRFGHGYREQQSMTEGWLDLVRRAAARDESLALEVAECARLIKGYGDTHARGVEHFQQIVEEIIEPTLAGELPFREGVEAVGRARQAALDNPEG